MSYPFPAPVLILFSSDRLPGCWALTQVMGEGGCPVFTLVIGISTWPGPGILEHLILPAPESESEMIQPELFW